MVEIRQSNSIKRHDDCTAKCPLLAQNGYGLLHRTCPLSGVKQPSGNPEFYELVTPHAGSGTGRMYAVPFLSVGARQRRRRFNVGGAYHLFRFPGSGFYREHGTPDVTGELDWCRQPSSPRSACWRLTTQGCLRFPCTLAALFLFMLVRASSAYHCSWSVCNSGTGRWPSPFNWHGDAHDYFQQEPSEETVKQTSLRPTGQRI